MAMHRTQILLERAQYEYLLRESRQMGVSISELLRRLVDQRMVASGPPEEDPLESLIGMAEDPGGFSGRDHDKLLYGDPRD